MLIKPLYDPLAHHDGDTVIAGEGTALLPSYTFQGDLDTGMWHPTSDEIAWSVGGAEYVRLTDAALTVKGTAGLVVTSNVNIGADFSDGTFATAAIDAGSGDIISTATVNVKRVLVDSISRPSAGGGYSFSGDESTGFWTFGTGKLAYDSDGFNVMSFERTRFQVSSVTVLGWNATDNFNTAPDIGFSRLGIGVLGLGTGAAGNFSGSLIVGTVGVNETAPETPIEITGTTATITGHIDIHSDADGSGAWILRGKREQSGGEETESGTITMSHDGTGDDQLAKLVLGVNTGAGVVDVVKINSDAIVDMLDHRVNNISDLNISGATELTISSGAVTITQGHHNIDTEGNATDDDLDTINGGESGDVIFILPNDEDRTVRIRHGIGNIYLKHQTAEQSYNFNSPTGGGGTFYVAGYYDWSSTDAGLNQTAPTSVTHGGSNVSYAAHVSIVAGGAGVVDTGVVKITVSGTTVDDEGNRAASQTVDLVADITTLSLNQYVETPEKFLGQVTIALATVSGSPVNFNVDINYGFSKYEDIGNTNFSITLLECVGRAGANDTGFNIRLFHHNTADWTYAASGFVPGPTAGDASELANMNTDHSTESNLSSGDPFAYKRTDINQDIVGDNGEGIVIEITTSAGRAVEAMDVHIGVHSAPKFGYMATTKQHLIFMKHGPNWLEL